jgi:hypothetical protein
MRQEVLWRSVRRILGTDEEILGVAYLWGRHRLLAPLVVLAALIGSGAAALAGFTSVASIAAVALAAVAVAASVSTEYRVLAVTEGGLVLMRGGRVRQVATALIERLPDSTKVERVSSNLVISEWRVGTNRFSALRRFESTMSAISMRFPAPE